MFDLIQQMESHDPSDMGSLQQDVLDRRARSEELETQILTLAGQINAAQYQFIKLLA